MLINADVKGLEVVVAAELSGDKVLKQEVIDKVDFHADNQKRFGLPDRVTAKRFIFKLLYGATAYGYTVDSDFLDVNFSQKQWQKVIDEFYTKYSGIHGWHAGLLATVKAQGYLEIPSGRYYEYKPVYRRGEYHWPLTTIKNYPVQGFGAELVKLARIEFYEAFSASGLEGDFICTIHDSLVVDTIEENCYNISMMLKNAVEKVPTLCKEHFDYDFSLPLTAEVQVGPNKYDMKEIKL
jgi:DNA polymerase-1